MLAPLEYERQREAAAEKLGCRASILDRLVRKERGEAEAAGKGRALSLLEPEPWPEPVGGAALIDGLAAAIRRYVVMSPAEAAATALWVVGVHAFDAWTIFPRLFVTAPERGCGKSTLLDVLSRLIPKPLMGSNISPATMFRVIEAARPTLLLDEADAYAKDNEDLRSVIDAGHRHDGAILRCVETPGRGDGYEPRQFSAWAPVALAAIGKLPGTIEDRSIIIRLRRRRPDEAIESLRLDRAPELDRLARQAARWAADHAAGLAAADPEMPAGTYNRVADNWRPLLAIAEAAAVGERARDVAIAMTTDSDDQDSTRITLLRDIRDAFAARGGDHLSSEALIAHLTGIEDRPWSEFGRSSKPISKVQLARLLRPLRIAPGTIRLGDATPKGYKRAAFEDAFARYLPPIRNATPPQPAETQVTQPISKRHNGDGEEVMWRFENAENASNPAACGGVAFRNPPEPEMHAREPDDEPPRRVIEP